MNPLTELLDIYWDNPVAFTEDMLDFYCDSWQEKVLMDLASSPKVSVRSGQGVGKTGLESIAALWYLACRPFPKVIATAPTKQQLHDVLWAEISKWLATSKIERLLEWTKTRVYMKGMAKDGLSLLGLRHDLKTCKDFMKSICYLS
ncbi:hypothetical protein HNQ80_004144 [Anaerosolibacter carboniphilus]|uniref:Terminase B n=1 Tax=Anaerosolibacter carboniphilus TaxID=1417629 RepID=A0A841KXC3_9FIRM|nr:hypothetical protein [Anaerosolibacter carboniphilus]